jgi:hypothetical protein
MANAPITTGTVYSLVTDHDPAALDSDYVDFVFWFNTTNGKLFWSTDLTEDNAVWKEVGLT